MSESNTHYPFLSVGAPLRVRRDALQAELCRHFYQRQHIYEHRWADGDIVLWDNLAVQHSRGTAGRGVRTPHRVTITELGYADRYPSDLGISESLGNRVMLAPPT